MWQLFCQGGCLSRLLMKGLHPRMLSGLWRIAVMTSVLIPWNTCGAYHAGVLGVPAVQYLPYAFLNYLNPIVAIVLTAMGKYIYWRKKQTKIS